MGASQSNAGGRTVTVDNDQPIGVVHLSDEVVQRLKGQHIQGLEARRAAAVAEQQQPHDGGAAVVARGSGSSSGFVHAEPTVTAVEVRRQKDAELRANDLYWAKRLATQEQAQLKTNGIQEKEFNAAVEDVRSRFKNAPPQHQTPPCRDLKSRLIECYRSHPGETLRCTQHVEAFTHCVNTHRAQLLDAKHTAAATTPIVPAPTAVKAH